MKRTICRTEPKAKKGFTPLKNIGIKPTINSGFTLIEMLTVIAIIAIIAGLITSAAQKARGKAMEAKAKAMINQFEIALSMYENDFGIYPQNGKYGDTLEETTASNGTDDSSETLYFFLGTKYRFVSGTKYGPYMAFKNNDLLTTGATITTDADGLTPTLYKILDPWGSEYVYVRAGVGQTDYKNASPKAASSDGTDATYYNPYTYQIYSKGPDKTTSTTNYYPGTETDDINNW